MLNLGGGEVLVILFLALIVLGPERLPKAAREVGKWVRELRRLSAGFQDEIRSAIDIDLDDDRGGTDQYRDGDRPFRPGQASLSGRVRHAAADTDADTGDGVEIRARNDRAPGADLERTVDTSAPAPPLAPIDETSGPRPAGAVEIDETEGIDEQTLVPPELDKPVSPGGPVDLRVVPPPADPRPAGAGEAAPGERATG
ncbi:MAG: twin-arginine translocase subunit TatB [Actinobacteria bacterium]|nr:twin-arginine translocase subunit TatB [Actinomycetota bacterium]